MILKIIYLLSCMAFFTEASNPLPLTKVPVKSNLPSFDGSSDSHINLIAEVSVYALTDTKFSTPYKLKMTLDSTSKNIWVPSDKCKSNCPTSPKTLLPYDTKKPGSIDNGNVNGFSDSYNLEIDSSVSEVEIMNANSVSRAEAKKVAASSNGVLGLNAMLIDNPEGLLSLCTSGPHQGLYLGIPEGVTKVNPKDNGRSSIPLLSSDEWKIKIETIRNSWGDWRSWCGTGCTAVIDSTFNGISGPKAEIESINEFLGADKQGNIPCYKANQLQSIYFFINSYRYELDAKNYIIKSDDIFNPKCRSAFMVKEGYDTEWRLGVPMLNQYLTVIDYNSRAISFMAMQ